MSILNTNIDEEKFKKMQKKMLVLFLSLCQILSEISIECKEKSILIYKVFKFYFSEIEKKWLMFCDKLNSKITYYKDLCKTILQYKNKNMLKIENKLCHYTLLEPFLEELMKDRNYKYYY